MLLVECVAPIHFIVEGYTLFDALLLLQIVLQWKLTEVNKGFFIVLSCFYCFLSWQFCSYNLLLQGFFRVLLFVSFDDVMSGDGSKGERIGGGRRGEQHWHTQGPKSFCVALMGVSKEKAYHHVRLQKTELWNAFPLPFPSLFFKPAILEKEKSWHGALPNSFQIKSTESRCLSRSDSNILKQWAAFADLFSDRAFAFPIDRPKSYM